MIFSDRGKKTAVAEIAHIRSEAPGGPRHDATFTGDVDGPDNLLLLCGKHHKPVDRHESTYGVAELETWKAAQVAAADGGTTLSDSDLRSYAVLATDDRKVLTDIARLAQRVVGLGKSAQLEIGALRVAHEKVRMDAWARMGPEWGVDDDGTEHLLGSEGFSLPPVEQREQKQQVVDAWEPHRLKILDALGRLDEEVAVLRMTFGGGPVAAAADRVLDTADLSIGDPTDLALGIDRLNGAVAQLWRIANGEADPPS